MKRALIRALIVACCASAPVGATSPMCNSLPAGVITDYAGAPGDYALVRSNDDIRIEIFHVLVAGDRLRVLSRNGYVEISRSDGSVAYVTSSDGEVCVADGSVPSLSGNAIRKIKDLLGKARDGRSGLVTRNEKPLLGPADLTEGTAIVTGGMRSFAVGWQGGVAPFSVTVTGPQGEIVAEENIDAQVLRLRAPLDLMPGLHRVSLIDATGARSQGAFTVSLDGEATEAESAQAAVFMAGDKLATSTHRRFDAFLVLSPFRASHETVKRLADALIEEAQ